MELVRAASPGSALRNRTLGLAALANILVPVPPIADQLWFDALQAKVATLRETQVAAATELDALLPAALDRAFNPEGRRRGRVLRDDDPAMSPSLGP